MCSIPSGEEKYSLCKNPPGEGKDSLYPTHKCIYPRVVVSRQTKNPSCWKQTETFPTRMGKTEGPPLNIVPNQRWIQAPIQRTSKTIQVPLHQQQLCRLQQTKCLINLYSRSAAERRHRSRAHPKQSRLLQPPVPGPQTRQPLEASYQPQLCKQISRNIQFQDGNPRINPCLPQKRGVGHIHRLNRHLPSCTYTPPVSQIPQICSQRRHLPIHQPPIRLSNSPIGVHKPSKRSQTHSPLKRNQTAALPGRLVDQSSFQRGLSQADTKTTDTNKQVRFCSESQGVRTHSLSEV